MTVGGTAVSRRRFLIASTGSALVVVGGLVRSPSAVAATPGSVTADLGYNWVSDVLNIKMYGAGWPSGTLRYTWRLYRGGQLLWQDTRVKYAATSFNYQTYRDCPGGGTYALLVECRGPGSTYEDDGDVVWV